MNYYLAIDIGASSGRHILMHKVNNKLITQEIYRFENQMTDYEGSLCWNVNDLFDEVIRGIKICSELNKMPYSLSIDTWGVDYVLLDNNGEIIGKTYGYRDLRTLGMDEIVEDVISDADLYKRTGIQKQPFNTIYQLMAAKVNEQEALEKAESFLMMPDYLHYRLTGIKTNEYTNATTTGLINCHTNCWDMELIDKLGFPKKIFKDLKMPKDTIGQLKEEIQKLVGFDCKVVACATHDTGSAAMAIPKIQSNSVFLSSGTWSLLGVENDSPITTAESKTANFTNEGGYDYRYRYLKNIMGLWMIQCAYHEFDEKYSYNEISEMAEDTEIDTLVNCNDKRFFAPVSMIDEIKLYAKETNQKIPLSIGEIASVVYDSLAECYKKAIKEIEEITGKELDSVQIIGGGANAQYLNKLTSIKTGLKVTAGPMEATAIGNGLCQMIQKGEFEDLDEARMCVMRSFGVKEYGG